jgi:hypothetical protein
MRKTGPVEEIPPDPFAGPSRVDRWLLVFVREPTLWPVLLVVIGHAIALLAPLLLWAIRDGQRGPGWTLALLALPCVAGISWELRDRGPGALTGLLFSTWALSVAAAIASDHYHLL